MLIDNFAGENDSLYYPRAAAGGWPKDDWWCLSEFAFAFASEYATSAETAEPPTYMCNLESSSF